MMSWRDSDFVRASLGALIALLLGYGPGPAGAQPLLDLQNGRGLFHNVKAADVGDIVTIKIVETASANTNAATDTNNKTEVSGGPGLGLLDLVTDWGIDSENKYKGDGKSSRSGSLNAQLSARVIEKLPNGNLRIEGNRIVEVNNEKQILTLRGLIRTRDLGSNNTIASTYIADAEIIYNGKGPIAQAHEPGVFTRLLNWFF